MPHCVQSINFSCFGTEINKINGLSVCLIRGPKQTGLHHTPVTEHEETPRKRGLIVIDTLSHEPTSVVMDVSGWRMPVRACSLWLIHKVHWRRASLIKGPPRHPRAKQHSHWNVRGPRGPPLHPARRGSPHIQWESCCKDFTPPLCSNAVVHYASWLLIPWSLFWFH